MDKKNNKIIRKTDKTISKVSVVIPAYNEALVIGKVIKDLKKIKEVSEILVVDDGSTDGTKNAAENAGAKVIRHPYNKGNGASVKTGIRQASNDIVILMDGDGQHSPSFIPKFIKQLEEYDLVIGSRDSAAEANSLRRIGNNILKMVASYLSGYKIKDLTSGYRAAKKEYIKEFLPLFPNRYSYPTTSTLAFLKAGYNVGYVPITTEKRVGKSKLKPFRNGFKFMLIILRISTLFSPMKFFLPLSVISLISGVIYGLYSVIDHMKLPNTAVLLISVGILIFMMGLISEQIAMLRFERHDR
jgi:glycosyltransferase involved in cell wall biosynthesis